MDFEKLSNLYSGKIIFHLPTINVTQSNLKTVKDTLTSLLNNDIKLVTIDASTLLYETYDWSTDEEQQNYLKNKFRDYRPNPFRIPSIIVDGFTLALLASFPTCLGLMGDGLIVQQSIETTYDFVKCLGNMIIPAVIVSPFTILNLSAIASFPASVNK